MTPKTWYENNASKPKRECERIQELIEKYKHKSPAKQKRDKKKTKRFYATKRKFNDFIIKNCFEDTFLKEVVSLIPSKIFNVLQGEVLFAPNFCRKDIMRLMVKDDRRKRGKLVRLK